MTAPTASQLLHGWLARDVTPEALAWLDEAAGRIASGSPDREVYMAISLVPRKVGKADLVLGEADLKAADAARPGWRPAGLSADQAARVLLVLSVDDPSRMAALVEKLCVTADVAELISFYLALPLYPEPQRYAARAREGVRSNMKALFNAVAHHNPYPSEEFDEPAWNQMVLKALFIGAPLWPVQRLDERANPPLARMLCDYAHERWAAGRTVSPELWRCVGRHADAAALRDLERVLESGGEMERRAAALALSDSADPAATAILERAPELTAEIAGGRLVWDDIRPA